jgi:hypothetical protein
MHAETRAIPDYATPLCPQEPAALPESLAEKLINGSGPGCE